MEAAGGSSPLGNLQTWSPSPHLHALSTKAQLCNPQSQSRDPVWRSPWVRHGTKTCSCWSPCRLLAQMRFRPWNGVFLCEEYLGGVEAAEGITRQILQVW